jgi:RsmE family RNA methyltransferase
MLLYISDLSNGIVSGENADHWYSLRPNAGQIFGITDLCGNRASVRVTVVDKRSHCISFEVLEKSTEPIQSNRILFQAITDKLYLEKMAEVVGVLGVSRVYLFQAQNSIQLSPNIERLQKIALRSNEQSEQVWGTNIEFLSSDVYQQSLQDHLPTVLELPEKSTKSGEISINYLSAIVGPEGGWTADELDYFISINLSFHSLGRSVYPSWLAGFSFFDTIDT